MSDQLVYSIKDFFTGMVERCQPNNSSVADECISIEQNGTDLIITLDTLKSDLFERSQGLAILKQLEIYLRQAGIDSVEITDQIVDYDRRTDIPTDQLAEEDRDNRAKMTITVPISTETESKLKTAYIACEANYLLEATILHFRTTAAQCFGLVDAGEAATGCIRSATALLDHIKANPPTFEDD